MMVDTLSSAPHYRVHSLPLWNALPDELRGQRIDLNGPQFNALRRPAIDPKRAVLVASFRDMGQAWHRGYRRIALMEHGIGQSYNGLGHGAYPGGPGRDPVGLFLSPNETAARNDRRAYPKARIEVIGDPVLDTLAARVPDGKITVAISFHWEWKGRVPETRSAFPHYRAVLPELAASFNLIGHSHPKARVEVLTPYKRAGIEYVADFDEVCRRADIYVCDNSSTIYEFASLGKPVLVLNAPWDRLSVEHGLRYWEAVDVGYQAWEPAELVEAIRFALSDPPTQQARREEALSIAYAYRTGATQRGADAIVDWLAEVEAAA